MTATSRIGGWLAAPVRGYQRWISPLRPPSCRFEPTCSAYAVEALTGRGPLVGATLAGWRLLRCAPWSRGGYDPVPPKRRTDGRAEPNRAVGAGGAAVTVGAGHSSGPCPLLRREPSVVS